MNTVRDIGRVGEHYAVYRLEQSGIQAIRVDREDTDIWAMLPDKTLVSIQVKSSNLIHEQAYRPPHYRFYFRKKKSAYVGGDIGVCVGLTKKGSVLVCIKDNFAVERRRDIRISEKYFTKEFEEKSIQRLKDQNPLIFIKQDTLQ